MPEYRPMAARWLCLGLFILAGCAAQPASNAALNSVPALQPSMARVWILRQRNVEAQNAAAADPIVYVNRASLGQIVQGTVFYHDVPPGTYRFTVQAYGTPAHLSDPVQLGPGVAGFLQVQAIPNWEAGSTVGGASFDVMTMVPYDARVAIPTLDFVGQR
jgi:hypothetical protein